MGVPGGMGEKYAYFHNSLCLLSTAPFENSLEGIRSCSGLLDKVLSESWSERYRDC